MKAIAGLSSRVALSLSLSMFASLLLTSCAPQPLSIDKQASAKKALSEKVTRIGLYLATADKAEKEGYIQTATYLREVAEEEIKHASKLTALLSGVKKTKTNLKELYKLEKLSSSMVYPGIAQAAKRSSDAKTMMLMDQMISDEKRHMAGLKSLLKDLR
ncbi:ferritin family protein [Elusimicrobiota bacterium]